MKKFQKMLLPVFDYVYNSGLLKKQSQLQTFVSHQGLVEILEKGPPLISGKGCGVIWKITLRGYLNRSKENKLHNPDESVSEKCSLPKTI